MHLYRGSSLFGYMDRPIYERSGDPNNLTFQSACIWRPQVTPTLRPRYIEFWPDMYPVSTKSTSYAPIAISQTMGGFFHITSTSHNVSPFRHERHHRHQHFHTAPLLWFDPTHLSQSDSWIKPFSHVAQTCFWFKSLQLSLGKVTRPRSPIYVRVFR